MWQITFRTLDVCCNSKSHPSPIRIQTLLYLRQRYRSSASQAYDPFRFLTVSTFVQAPSTKISNLSFISGDSPSALIASYQSFNHSRSLDVLDLEALVLYGLNTHIKITEPNTIERPAWTSDFSREGFRKLVEKCQQKGIKLSGGSFGAFELEEQFDRRELENGIGQRFEEV